MTSKVKFGVCNAIVALLIGLYVDANASGEGYSGIAIAAPLAAFLTAEFFWGWLIRPDGPINVGRVTIVGLLTGTASHYVMFILLSIGMNLCFWTTGGCVGSLGEPPASILSMLAGAFSYSFFSLMIAGWISVPASIVIGLFFLSRVKSK